MVAAQKALLIQEATPVPVMQTLTVPRDGGQAKVLDDISAVAVLSSGERLVADRGQRGVFRFDTAGKYLGPSPRFARPYRARSGRAVALARS